MLISLNVDPKSELAKELAGPLLELASQRASSEGLYLDGTLAANVVNMATDGSEANPRLSFSLVRGLAILACFGLEKAAHGKVELGVQEISRKTEITPSTTHRYLTTLVACGLVERDPDTRKYKPAQRLSISLD